jgi:sensor domain CHASE-containing protein
VLAHLKTDIESLSRSILIVAAIEERQQLQRQQEAKRRQELEAATKKLREQQCAERLRQVEALKQLLGRFDSAINIHDVNQAQHVFWVLGQQNQDILSLALYDQAPDMALARMKQQVQSLRRDLFGHQGIQNLDAPVTALS